MPSAQVDQDAVQMPPLTFDQQDGGNDHAQQSQNSAHAHAVEGCALEVPVGDQRGIVVDDQLGVLQADKGHKQVDARQRRRSGQWGIYIEDALAHIGQGTVQWKMTPSTKTAIRASRQL